MSNGESRRRRMTADDWVRIGMETLASEGILGVRIDDLAAHLGVTKGSFYSHFSSRDELLTAMARHWRDRDVDSVAQQVCELGGDPRMRLAMLIALYQQRDLAPIDRGMRAWAQSDQRAAEAVQAASERIERLLVDIFAEIGFSPADAQLRAMIFLLCGIGAVFAVETAYGTDTPKDLRERFVELLTNPQLATDDSEGAAIPSALERGRG